MANTKLSLDERLARAEAQVRNLRMQKSIESDPRLIGIRTILDDLLMQESQYSRMYSITNSNPDHRLERTRARYEAAVIGAEYHRRNRDLVGKQITYLKTGIINLQSNGFDISSITRNIPSDPLLDNLKKDFDAAESKWRKMAMKPTKASKKQKKSPTTIKFLKKEYPEAKWEYVGQSSGCHEWRGIAYSGAMTAKLTPEGVQVSAATLQVLE